MVEVNMLSVRGHAWLVVQNEEAIIEVYWLSFVLSKILARNICMYQTLIEWVPRYILEGSSRAPAYGNGHRYHCVLQFPDISRQITGEHSAHFCTAIR